MSAKLPTSSNVLSVNLSKNSYVTNVSNVLQESSIVSYDKKQFSISYLNTQHFLNSQLEISANIPEEDLEDAIYNKAYDELALDQAIEYQINFIELFNVNKEGVRKFQIFVVDPRTVERLSLKTVKKINYIDILIPTPLLLRSLYEREIIQSNATECFVYLQEDDAFLAVYNNQEYVYSISLKYSLKYMHDKFCESYGEAIEYSDFVYFISTKNLKKSETPYKEHLIKIYKELFANVNEILTYVKRAFELNEIETVYVGSSFQMVTKLYEIAEVELNIRSNDFDFNYGYRKSTTYIEPLHSLMHLYVSLPQEAKYECNFSNNPRPPKFQKRISGKLILAVAASLVIAFAYPVTNWILSSAQDVQKNSLEDEYSKVHNDKIQIEESLKKIETDKLKANTLLKAEKDAYYDKKSTLVKIHDVKVNYPMKAKIITLLSEDLNRYDVKLEALSYKEYVSDKNFNLYLVADRDEDITNLVKHLTQKYSDKFLFSLEKIYLEKESGKYFTELKIEIQ
jgi:hypothetical protein